MKNLSASKLNLKNRGFNDKLYFLNLKLTWCFVAICILLTVFSGFLGIQDLSIISYGIPAAFAELGIHTGFIVWKAKAENCRKFGKVEEDEYSE